VAAAEAAACKLVVAAKVKPMHKTEVPRVLGAVAECEAVAWDKVAECEEDVAVAAEMRFKH
jgi:hypothetical protein